MNKHIVILEDGTKATRNSQNRIYTHAIALSPLDKDVAIEQFTRIYNDQLDAIKDAEVRLAALKKDGVTITLDTGFNTEWAKFSVNGEPVYLSGVHQFGTITEEEATATAIINTEERITLLTRRCERIQADIERTKAEGQSGNWGIVTWCGRYDLAVTQLNKWSQLRGHTAKIVEVERVGA
jgi:uncharacterized small protein (DUF1192 family)